MFPKTFCVVSHTHWDREWYLPLECMRLRLCDLMDRFIKIAERQPEYIFHLDAQTIVLEDYLSIRPERRKQLEKLISEGRLLVGPWYLQNDFYLTSGEATVRNLLEGRRLACEFGACDTVGYAPDQFGHISQMPQILRGFGIDNYICARGFDGDYPDGTPRPSEYCWVGADGSDLLTVYMRYWYNNAQHFSPDPDKAEILVQSNDELFDGIATTPYILMMNGVDHTEAQPDLLPILESLNRRGGYAIRQYKLHDYVDDVRRYIRDRGITLDVHKGEMRTGYSVDSLRHTLSSRFYLKAENVKAQTMLENRLEPLYAMLSLAGAREAYSGGHFRYMWKQLLQNHPHDSICGCSRDEVHAHMEDNYARLETTARDMLARGMETAAAHLALPGRTPENYLITLANTTQLPLGGVVELSVDIPKKDGAAGIDIRDGAGAEADYLVLSKSDAVRDGFSPLNLPGTIPVDRYRISLRTDAVLPFAFKGFVVTGAARANPAEPAKEKPGGGVMENEALRVVVADDGRVSLQDKRSGLRVGDLLEIEDTGDRGDAYYYAPSGGAPVYGSAFPAVVTTLRSDRIVQEIRIERELTLPAAYDFDSRRRTDETAVTRTAVTLRLTAGSPRLEVTFSADNRSQDHRLRLLVNTGLDSELSVADIPFDIITHDRAESLANTTSQVEANTSFAAVESGGKGLAVLTEGAHEYEHLADRSALAFTLVRSTGVICRNHDTMEQVGGDQWTAPENQCLRTVSGRFAVQPYQGEAADAGIPLEAVRFRAGLAAHYTSGDPTRFMQGRAAVQDSRLDECFFLDDPYEGLLIPEGRSLLTVDGDGLLVTALKQAEDENGLVLRLVNLTAHSRAARVRVPDRSIGISDLSETQPQQLMGPKADMHIAPKKIITLRMTDR